MHGGARQNAGRKSKAEELKLAETIDTALGEDWVNHLLKKIYEQAKQGSFNQQQLLIAYKFGKPQDKVDLTSKGNEIKQITGMVVK